MEIDLENFSPDSVSELADAIVSELSDLGPKWWSVNSELVSGYLSSLAEAAMQTNLALAQNRLKPAEAKQILHMQELAFASTIHFTKYMSFVLAQKVLDMTFKIIGWALFNKTGINLFPQIVKPT